LDYFIYVADEEKLFRLPDSRASDGTCIVPSDQVYSEGDTFMYGDHTWYVSLIVYNGCIISQNKFLALQRLLYPKVTRLNSLPPPKGWCLSPFVCLFVCLSLRLWTGLLRKLWINFRGILWRVRHRDKKQSVILWGLSISY